MRCRVVCQVILLCAASPFLRAADCGPSRYDCAVYYVEHHDLDTAIQVLREELQQSPRNLKALNLLGIALTESGRGEEANREFRAALAIDPSFYPARKNLAINEFDLHHPAEAAANLHQVLQQAPDDPIAHIYLAEVSFQEKDYAAALSHYRKAGERAISRPVWALHYAQCLATSRQATEAETILRSLPVNGDMQFEGGLVLGRAGDYSGAAALFASSRSTYHDPYLAAYNQLLMLVRAGQYPAAITLFQELVAQGYGRAELYNLVSEAYRGTGSLQQAYDSLRTATRLEPTAEDNYVDLAALCLDNHDYDLALQILDIGIHYVPDSYRMYVQRGFTLVMRGRTQAAEKEFLTASKLAPNKSLPYIALGEVWMQMGQAQKAADMLREKSNLPGVDFLLPYVFAEALIRSGADAGTPQAREAARALQTSIRLNPKFARSHAELGKLLLRDGKIPLAIPELKIATELDPSDSGPFYQLGQAYRKTGQKEKANEMMARVEQLHSPEREMDVGKELQRLVKQDTAPSPTEAKP